MLGYRDDATRLIAAADLFVLASHHEGLPVTVMEALTLGVPVVAPAVGGLPEVVTTGTNGILVAARSAPALADAIAQAVEPEVHAHLVAGASRTGDRFSSRHAIARDRSRLRGAGAHTSFVSQRQQHRGGEHERRDRQRHCGPGGVLEPRDA